MVPSEVKRKWYAANRDRVIERRRQYRLKNFKRLAEESRMYYHANLESQRAKAREQMRKARLKAKVLAEVPSSRGRFGGRGCHTDLPSREVVFLERVLNLLRSELGNDLAGVLFFV